jgi:hypothetical protein
MHATRINIEKREEMSSHTLPLLFIPICSPFSFDGLGLYLAK